MTELVRVFPVILLVAVFVAGGQAFLKLAVMQAIGPNLAISASNLAAQFLRLVCIPQFWLGGALSGLGFLGWLFILTRIELSKAVLTLIVLYPVLILIAGMLIGETKSWQNVLGVGIAVAGLWLATWNFAT